jgi:hypothetical protein
MRKDVTICFRTSKEVRDSIEKIRQNTKRSISSVIEDIISCYLRDNNKSLECGDKEHRRFSRKEVAIPVVIKDPDEEARMLQAGIILDISLGGLRISLPKDFVGEASITSNSNEFEAIFTLPNEKRPISIKCKPQRTISTDDAKQMGASFVDSDFSSYKTLQSYLI